MSKVTILVMLLTVISKIFGFLRISVVNSLFGSGPVSNVFINVFEFPTTMMSLVAISIILSMIPTYSSIEKNSEKRAELYISNLFNIVVFISAIVSLLVFLFPGVTVNLFYDYQTSYEIELATLFMRVVAFGSLCLSISNMMNGYLNLKDSFIIPASLSVVLNVIVISGVYFASISDIILLPYAVMAGFLIEALVAFYFATKKGFRLRNSLRFNIPSVKHTFRMSFPIMINTWISQLGIAVRRYLGTGLGTSAPVYFNSAVIISTSVQGIFATSILNVMYPTLSRQAARNNIAGVKKTIRDLIVVMGVFVIPITVGGMILSTPLMTLLYHRGAFTMVDVTNTAQIFFISCLSFFPLCIVDLMLQVFYSLKNTKLPMRIEGINLAISVILMLVLSQLYGIVGLIIAQVISLSLKMLLMIIIFIKQYGGFGFKLVISDLLKIMLATAVMGLVTYFSYDVISAMAGNTMATLLALVLSIVVYLPVIFFSRIESVDLFIASMTKGRK